MINDWINGSFEFLGGILCWVNFFKLKKEKQVRGVHWPITAFFSIWSIWNLLYYPSINQMASFYGGIGLAVGNAAWVALAIKYRKR